jgi:DNA mismatch repair protein MutL
VGKPEAARKKGTQECFFVNGRYMRHPYFHKAVLNAYERLVPAGMQVPYFIYFDVNPADIDVNIHPVKTEIKFENEQAIWQILSAAVKDAIGRFCEVPSIDFDTQGRPDIPAFDPGNSAAQPSPQYNRDYNPFRSQTERKASVPEDWQQLYEGLRPQTEEQNIFNTVSPREKTDGVSLLSSAPLLEDKSPAHYQYKGKYIMTAVKSGLMVIDQHRASVRILFERYMEQLRNHTASTQRVLFPEVVQFAPSDAVLLTILLPELDNIGFDLSDLGQFSYAVNGVPAGIEGLNPVQLLRDIVSDAQEKSVDAAEELSRSLAQSMAQHAAIPYGQILSNDEMESLVNELFACSNVNYTPDGHPILAILPQRDIERLLT